jgi:putative hemolysin
MQDFIRQIVDELIALDSELAADRKSLEALVAKLLAAKPKIKLDAAFRKRLKSEILSKLRESEASPTKSFNPFTMQKLFYSLVGVTASLMIILPLWQPWNISTSDFNFSSGVSISQARDAAFGDLSVTNTAPYAAGRGGGGGGAATAVATPEAMMSDSKMMPPYETTAYKYIYDGMIPLTDIDVDVLQRIRGVNLSSSLTKNLLGFDLGLVNLYKLKNSQVRNFNISDNSEYGYDVYINLDEGSVNINQRYESWPDPYRDCREESCYESLRMKASDMLADATVIEIADDFIREMGIDTSAYRQPFIQSAWKADLARIQNPADFYYPESVNVIYPLQIRGETVHNESGYADGLNVSVSQRFKKVTNMWGLQIQNYEASRYAAVTDETLFRKILTKGGLWGWNPENATKIIEVQLGAPERILVKNWIYENTVSKELIVPALRFPILNKPQDLYQDSIVIPLVDEILRKAAENNLIGNPIPLEAVVTTEEAKPEVAPAAPEASSTEVMPAEEAKPTSETTTLANPASVKCAADGYTLEIITAEDGSQSGFCKNAEGKGCEEWQYFRGECEIPAVG